ncbi:major facilitator superfamily MFS_1 [Rubrobacter xylanophilus DSM 9941]|uniref:Major facilitator superfamily MFS_1 n=1 Tax=Rubrobacter xylanophilus (strain DSM 9941 / JCM 11954 / NBRC 16129 / PRD-1) TaxID=266117 RepID=Q1AS00_RUBXD|nr:MFS transporter [Rubrobacter xylanophilus]ABG05828.1 major facilitator superfamily MFS_1 [Rubrobacter xylanophilus DSM 9941]
MPGGFSVTGGRARKPPAFDRRVWLLVGAMLVFRFGQGLFYPFSTIYFHNFVGIPLSLIGAGLGLLAAASVLSGLASGPLADRYGRKPVMLAALSGSAASFALFAAAGGLPGYLAACLVAGLAGSSMFDASRNAMVADVTPAGLRARAYGLVRVGGNVGWALGPAAAGLVAASAGSSAGTYRLMFAGTAALTLLVALSLALLVAESRPALAAGGSPSPGALREALSDGRFAALLGAAFLLYYVFAQDWQALPVYARNFLGMEEGRIGLFLAGNGLVVILLQMPVARLLDARSKMGALLVCSLLFAASAATLLITESFLGILVAFAGFFTLAEMILEVAGAALAAGMAPPGRRGTYLALFGVCFGAAQGISPVVAGALLDARMPDAVWGLQLAAAGLAAAALLALRRRGLRRP